jgi:hypothetical protein
MQVPTPELWLPILVSSVLVWIASALAWTVMPHRRHEFKRLSHDDAVRTALKGLGPGEYAVPSATGSNPMKDPDFLRKYEEGPVGLVRIWAPGRPAMGKPMVLSFLAYLVVGITVAYVAGVTLAPGTNFLAVFRVTGTVAWAAYFFAQVPDSIWFGRPWASTAKLCVEAFAYGCLTGAIFGWLWVG